ncbi:MAG: DUF3616 domain-containing protein [Magnetococcales bacterium]|nr:DUF3616 domain-containing protein [Magnetococcales bacterium]
MSNQKRVWSLMLAAVLCCAVAEVNAGSWTLSCPDDTKKLPHLVADVGPLEPSGVVWDPVNKVALAVSDESSPQALFVFDPARVVESKSGKTIQAFPLLTPAMVEKYHPKDMEGITRLASGEFVATASHSLKKGKPQDTMLRFRLKKGSSATQPWEADQVDVIPAGKDGFRSWLLHSAKPPWDDKIGAQEGESGINVEGITASLQGNLLYLGFRGPISADKIPVLTLRLNADRTLVLDKWHALKLDKNFETGGVVGIGKEPLGIRDMAAVASGKGNEFLLLMGASGSGSDLPFQLGWWRDDQQEIKLVGRVPKGFRAEGLTVLSHTGGSMQLLLVSDKNSLVMECQVTSKN